MTKTAVTSLCMVLWIRVFQIILLLCSPAASAASTSNPDASAAARATLDYLANLPQASDTRLIVGQHVGFTTSYYINSTDYVPLGYQAFVLPLQQQTGKWLGLIGVDFSTIDPNYSYPLDYAKVTQTLIEHWNKGGLVTVMYSARNPWTWKSANDRSVMTPMSDVVQSGTTANSNWRTQLDSVAAGLKVLRDAGVVVLFRPLHEINGNWFWWGDNKANPGNVADTVALWRYTHDYLTHYHALDNLLWVYAATAFNGAGVTADELKFYPGDNYVDIVGLDVYRTTFGSAEISGFNKLRALGKPLCLCEFGPNTKASDGSFDYYGLLSAEIKNKVPDITYMMAWADYPSGSGKANNALVSNRNADTMLGDPWVVTADEIPANTHGSGLPDPFVFTAVRNAAPSVLVTSNSVVLSGFDGTLPISVSGGEYSLDAQAFTLTAGTVSSGSSVVLRTTSADARGRRVSAVLHVGGRSASFNVTTYGAGSPPLMLLLD